jgi:peptide/nickel transport system ATP-binding protein/oligopeptide transport system ATP-binding protein
LRQRVLIAAALSAEPKVLLCDEPTTALDVTVQRQILELLSHLRERYELAILYVTHDLGVVAELCDRVEVMYAGRIVETGSVAEVFSDPLHAYTLGLTQALPDHRAARSRFRSIPGVPPNLALLPTGCAFSPRCSIATAACSVSPPALEQVGRTRFTACLHWRRVAERAQVAR